MNMVCYISNVYFILDVTSSFKLLWYYDKFAMYSIEMWVSLSYIWKYDAQQ